MNRNSLLLLAAITTIISANVFYFVYWNDIMTYGVYLILFLFTSTTTVASLVKIHKKSLLWWIILIPNIYLIFAQIAFVALFFFLGGPEIVFERMHGDLLRR